MNDQLAIWDRVIIMEQGDDYGKMCTIIEGSKENDELLVRIRLVNSHDTFRVDGILIDSRTEKWISREKLSFYHSKEFKQ